MVAHHFRVLRRLGWPFAGLIVTVAAGLTGSCDKMPLLAPSGSAITLVSTSNVLAVNGQADIIATVIEGGTATPSTPNGQPTVSAGTGTPVHNGTQVKFSTTLGRIEPAQASTQDGSVTVKLVGDGRSGTATITAISGAAKSTLDVKIGAAGAARIAVTASPQALPFTGGTSTITARVEDLQGNGLDGVPVSFSTTAGSLASTLIISGNGGLAATNLNTSAAATVTASAGGATASLTGTVAITLKPRTTVTLTVPGTGAVSVPTSITVGVGANTIVKDVLLEFGDGEKVSLGELSANTNVVHLYGSADTFTVKATATDTDGNTPSISSQIAILPLTASGSASPSTVPVGTPAVLTVTVTPTGASIAGYDWDFGDGTRADGTSSPTISHNFTSRGNKTVTVRIRPTKGAPIFVLIQVDVS
jgi:hypothetical protein